MWLANLLVIENKIMLLPYTKAIAMFKYTKEH